MLFAYIDKDGRIETACNDETVVVLPENAFALREDQWDNRFNLRHNGVEFVLDPLPVLEPKDPPPTIDPIEKLRAFLAANPDVAAIL